MCSRCLPPEGRELPGIATEELLCPGAWAVLKIMQCDDKPTTVPGVHLSGEREASPVPMSKRLWGIEFILIQAEGEVRGRAPWDDTSVVTIKTENVGWVW